MKGIKRLKERLTGLTAAINRFPLTSLILLAAAANNAYIIATETHNTKWLVTLLVGALLSTVGQVSYERFYSKLSVRFILMGVVALLTAGYYLIIRPAPEFSMEIETRTIVALFALLIAFIWVPVIKSKISFNQSSMIAFKSLFIALFFSGVILGGISIILLAVDQLLFAVDDTVYPHAANIIFLIFAPMYFLSLIPVYPREGDEEESIKKTAQFPKFLEILICYIVIPLIAVFTLILVVYIVQNINGEFWTDNLLEPMLVSYAITVILVYILGSEIENKFAVFFRKISPKVLVPIVIFQIVSSYITLTNTGITHYRYYVILFGIFAVISGVLMSFLTVNKNGMIAAILIVFATISIMPPVDAFTISKSSQTKTLEEVLVQNNMLVNNKITSNKSISDEDKEKITNAIEYLNMMGYTNELAYLPKDFNTYEDFHNTFGFEPYRNPVKYHTDEYTFVSINHPADPLQITGHDFFVQMDITLHSDFKEENKQYKIHKDGTKYILLKDVADDKVDIKLMSENRENILLTFSTNEILEKFAAYHGENIISNEEATIVKENDRAKMTIFLQTYQTDVSHPYISIMMYVFIQIR